MFVGIIAYKFNKSKVFCMNDIEKYMLRAIELAQKAAENDEVPVGAVVVNPQNGEIVAEAYNLSEHGDNACEHAEIIAMRKACKKLGSNRLWDMDLYVTLEPCTMCATAISFMRIRKLFFGAEDKKGGAIRHRLFCVELNGKVLFFRDQVDRIGSDILHVELPVLEGDRDLHRDVFDRPFVEQSFAVVD